jgi:hypothetical protein
MFTIINAIIFISVNNNTGSIIVMESNYIISITSLFFYILIIMNAIQFKKYQYLFLLFHVVYDCFILLGYENRLQLNNLFYIFTLLQIFIGVIILGFFIFIKLREYDTILKEIRLLYNDSIN